MEAIVLAGGLGTRLRTRFHDLPKVMVPVAGRPFLEYVLEHLARQGVQHVVLSVGYLREMIIEHFHFSFQGLKISYAIEKEPLGTGGGIRLAMEQVLGEDIFVINGDTIFYVDLKRMQEYYFHNKKPVLLALKQLVDVSRYGSVKVNKLGNITQFIEKQNITSTGLINGGVYLVNKTFFCSQPLPEKFSMEKDFFESQVDKGNLSAYLSDSYFIDIGIPEDYDRAQQEFI